MSARDSGRDPKENRLAGQTAAQIEALDLSEEPIIEQKPEISVSCKRCGDPVSVSDAKVVIPRVPESLKRAMWGTFGPCCLSLIKDILDKANQLAKLNGDDPNLFADRILNYKDGQDSARRFFKNKVRYGLDKDGCSFCTAREPKGEEHQVIVIPEGLDIDEDVKILHGRKACPVHIEAARLTEWFEVMTFAEWEESEKNRLKFEMDKLGDDFNNFQPSANNVRSIKPK